jgi:hypothetical protein
MAKKTGHTYKPEGRKWRVALIDDLDDKRAREAAELQRALGPEWIVKAFKLGSITWTEIAEYEPDGIILDLVVQSAEPNKRTDASTRLLRGLHGWDRFDKVTVIVESVEALPTEVRPNIIKCSPYAIRAWAEQLWEAVKQ